MSNLNGDAAHKASGGKKCVDERAHDVFNRAALLRNWQRFEASPLRDILVSHLRERFPLVKGLRGASRVLELGAREDKLLPTCLATQPTWVDEECLPFANESFCAVVSSGFLHWVNNWPNMLQEIRRVLVPGGTFLANFWGERTMWELAHAFAQAEQKMSPHVSLFCRHQDIARLLQTHAFTDVVTDMDELQHFYPTPAHLMHMLKAAGETNILTSRRLALTTPRMMDRMSAAYQATFGTLQGVPATFGVVTLVAYSP